MLADFHLHNGRKVAAFDINADDPALTQFMPAHSAPADIADIHGQMALFDRLIADDGSYKIVDLGHPSFKSFFKVASDIGFADEARRRDIAPVVLFVVSPDDPLGRCLCRAASGIFRRPRIVPVHNEGFGGAQHRDKFAALGPGALLHAVSRAGAGPAEAHRAAAVLVCRSAHLPATEMALEAHIELQNWLRGISRVPRNGIAGSAERCAEFAANRS